MSNRDAENPAMRYHAPYMEWAKTRPSATYDLAGSNILACSFDDLPDWRDAIALTGDNDNGYGPLVEAIAARYGVNSNQVTTAAGASGANFLVFAALLAPGDEVLVERPGYDPLLGAARLVGAVTRRFDRPFEDGFALDPARVQRAMTPRTRLIVVTHPHNPSGVAVGAAALDEVGRIAARAGAHVLVDEVYHDVSLEESVAARRGDVFISTSSLTKSYGLSGLRSGWVLSSEALAYRLRRARDVIDGTGSIVGERLSVLAFQHLDQLTERARGILQRNTAITRQFLESRAELSWAPSSGTIVFPRILGVEDSTQFVDRLLKERGTAVGPGRFFEAPAHFRLGFGGDTGKLHAGLAQVGAALDAR